jgi:hypothetical protein
MPSSDATGVSVPPHGGSDLATNGTIFAPPTANSASRRPRAPDGTRNESEESRVAKSSLKEGSLRPRQHRGRS